MKEKTERFVKYMEIKGLNDNQVTKQCGFAQGLLGQARKGKSDLGAKSIEKILSVYQDLSRVWLLTGEGQMLKATQEEKHESICQEEEPLSSMIVRMMNEKQIAPYGLVEDKDKKIEDKDKKIEELNREIGKLEAMIEIYKKRAARVDDAVGVADVG